MLSVNITVMFETGNVKSIILNDLDGTADSHVNHFKNLAWNAAPPFFDGILISQQALN